MQWEGQDLHTQLFSPTGPAQEVPVSVNPHVHAHTDSLVHLDSEKEHESSFSSANPATLYDKLFYCYWH